MGDSPPPSVTEHGNILVRWNCLVVMSVYELLFVDFVSKLKFVKGCSILVKNNVRKEKIKFFGVYLRL